MSCKSAKITSEKEVTIEDVVNESVAMWKKVQNYWRELAKNISLTFGDDKYMEIAGKILDKMHTEHREFSTAYPIVVKYMCHMQQYRKKAFELWLNRIKNSPWKNENEYIESHADYVVTLYRVIQPRTSTKELAKIRTEIHSVLKNEHETLRNYAKSAEKKVLDSEKKMKESNAKELKEFCQKINIDDMQYAGKIIPAEMDTYVAAENLDDNISEFMEIEPTLRADDLLFTQ